MPVTYTLTSDIPQITAALRVQAGAIVLATAHQIETRVKLAMQASKHGRTYRRGAIKRYFRPGSRTAQTYAAAGLEMGATASGKRVYAITGYKLHVASAPGEAPAIDYGQLVNSIQVASAGPLTAYVNVHADYGLALELGTARVAARPFLGPAVQAEANDFSAAMKGLFPQG